MDCDGTNSASDLLVLLGQFGTASSVEIVTFQTLAAIPRWPGSGSQLISAASEARDAGNACSEAGLAGRKDRKISNDLNLAEIQEALGQTEAANDQNRSEFSQAW